MSRLNILTAIQAKLQTLSDFETVYGQAIDFEYGVNAISFFPLIHEYRANNLSYENELEIQVRAIKFTNNFLEDGEALLNELETLARDENWDNNCYKTLLLRSEIRFEEKGKKALLIEFSFKVLYRT